MHMTNKADNDSKDLDLLNFLAEKPEVSQAEIAKQLGFAVGTVNQRLKALVRKGYLQSTPGTKRKINHQLTKDGQATRERMNAAKIDASFSAFRTLRAQMLNALADCELKDMNEIGLAGQGDALEICRLIAVDRGFKIVSKTKGLPVIRVAGLELKINFPSSSLKK